MKWGIKTNEKFINCNPHTWIAENNLQISKKNLQKHKECRTDFTIFDTYKIIQVCSEIKYFFENFFRKFRRILHFSHNNNECVKKIFLTQKIIYSGL